VSAEKAPASEGGRYKGEPKSAVSSKLASKIGASRSDRATGTAREGILILGWGYGRKSGGKPPHSKLRGGK
jgi:hypothetical protein